MIRPIFISIVVILLSSCATRGTLKNGVFESRAAHYRISSPGDGWVSVNIRDVDIAWVSSKDNASILVNANCAGTEDAPLVALTGHLLIGMTEQEIVQQKAIDSSGRQGLETVVKARLDGVAQKMKIFVMKKDMCLYDVVLSSAPEDFDKNQMAFDRMMQSFEVGNRS